MSLEPRPDDKMQPPPAPPIPAIPVPHGAHYRVLEAGKGGGRLDLGELWHYRDLLYFLTRREVAIRYKQTALGVAWAVLQPLLTMIVFTLFLGKLGKMPSDGIPYPVFSYLGLLPWTYFANAVTRGSASLVSNANLLSKVYFPRLLIPLAATLSALVDFAVAFAVLLGLMAWYGIAPSWGTLWIAPLALLTALAATGVSMGLAALNVQYRDVQHAIPFLMQIWLFASPVVYPLSRVPLRYRFLYQLNPMAGIVEASRAVPLGRAVDLQALAISIAMSLVSLLLGYLRFRRMERSFADIV